MRVAYTYSHLNGLEYLMVHHPDLWKEVREVIESIDAESCRTKVSKEKRNPGKKLYSPVDMNEAFKDGFVLKTILFQLRRKAQCTVSRWVVYKSPKTPSGLEQTARGVFCRIVFISPLKYGNGSEELNVRIRCS